MKLLYYIYWINKNKIVESNYHVLEFKELRVVEDHVYVKWELVPENPRGYPSEN